MFPDNGAVLICPNEPAHNLCLRCLIPFHPHTGRHPKKTPSWTCSVPYNIINSSTSRPDRAPLHSPCVVRDWILTWKPCSPLFHLFYHYAQPLFSVLKDCNRFSTLGPISINLLIMTQLFFSLSLVMSPWDMFLLSRRHWRLFLEWIKSVVIQVASELY